MLLFCRVGARRRLGPTADSQGSLAWQASSASSGAILAGCCSVGPASRRSALQGAADTLQGLEMTNVSSRALYVGCRACQDSSASSHSEQSISALGPGPACSGGARSRRCNIQIARWSRPFCHPKQESRSGKVRLISMPTSLWGRPVGSSLIVNQSLSQACSNGQTAIDT